MTLRHDPLLTRALAGEIGRRWGGARAASLHLAREPRSAELRFREAPSLLFLLHPEEGAILESDPVLPGEGSTFRRLFVGVPRTPPDERILLLPLVDGRGRERHRVAVELHTNQWNLLLLDAPRPGSDEPPRVRAALWPRRTAHRTLEAGAPYEPPPGSRAWATAPPQWEAWHELLASVPPADRRGAALGGAAWLSSVNVSHVLGSAAREEGEGPLRAAFERYLELRRSAELDGEGGAEPAGGVEPPSGRPRASEREPRAWLLERPWGLQPYPVSLEEPDVRAVPSLLTAMEQAYGGAEARERRTRELALEAAAPGEGVQAGRRRDLVRLRRALVNRHQRMERRKAALARELERAAPPEASREIGHLLLARLHEVRRGAERVTLQGFDGEEREIELDPRLEPSENAEAYFEEAARRERARERIPGEIESAERTRRAVDAGLDAVEAALAAWRGEGERAPETDLDEERIETLWELVGGRPQPGGPDREEGERTPYLRYRSSGGLEIRVGRSARTNDELTFHHSAPEDIWLHARQVQGAHVILRWGRKEENPPRQDLLEAAVAAAVHSGARHSGTVAVDWTRRKYVRKPRKAPPGAVVPDRVKTVFVEPDDELLERRKLEG